MKEKLRKIIRDSAAKYGELPAFEIERPKVKSHGELATNLAMILAKKVGKKPIDLANEIIASLVDPEALVESVTVAGGGFLNFTLKKSAWQKSLDEILAAGENFGVSDVGKGKKVVVEFVSANPTGPIHIGNARGGPLGDAIAALLQKVGYAVTREFYVNDVGGQIDQLGFSIFCVMNDRDDPKMQYKGSYIDEIIGELKETGSIFKEYERMMSQPDGDKEAIPFLGRFGLNYLLEQIKQDCEEMGIRFDSWVHEKEVLGSGDTQRIIDELKKNKRTVEKEGALWFESSDAAAGEEPDRESVLVRSDGRPTYFANDIAYHLRKYRQGYDRLINIWGSNHHGHVPRLEAAMAALGQDPKKMETVLYQYVRVKRGNEAVKMSKRGGNFVTAREVLEEAGKDAFRFFLLMRAPESHLDFDLELATKHSQENPVYYLQYAHARLASIFRKAKEQGLSLDENQMRGTGGELVSSPVKLEKLDLPEEIELIRMINEYPEEIVRAAERLEPHRVSFYLLELAKAFQGYYSKAKEDPKYKVLSADVDTSRAKMYLCRALKLTLSQGLKLLGVSAPEVMVSPEISKE